MLRSGSGGLKGDFAFILVLRYLNRADTTYSSVTLANRPNLPSAILGKAPDRIHDQTPVWLSSIAD